MDSPRIRADAFVCSTGFVSMPVRYVIYPQYRLVVSSAAGRLTFEEVSGHQDQLLADPDFVPEFNQLYDVTAATNVALSGDELKRLLGRQVFSSTSRRALVANTTYLYGMGRMTLTYYEMSKQVAPMSLFRDRTSALRWLGVPEDSRLY